MPDVIIKDIEMPDGCPMCPMSHWNKLDEFTGCDVVPGRQYAVIHDKEYAKSPARSRPDWCPLRPAPEWISVEERLPEMGCKCLVFWHTHGELCIDTAFRLDNGWNATHWELAADITHWMPLPEPPEVNKWENGSM